MMPQQAVQEPPKPPAPPAAPKEGSSNRRFVIPAAIVGGIAVVAVIAVVATGGGGDKPAAATTAATPAATAAADVPIAASGIALKVPAGWSEGGDAATVPGLADGAVTVGGPEGGTIVIGNADKTAANSTLLPDALRTADLPAGTPVDLTDGVQALHYENVKIGDETGSIFAVPTSKGVATLACVAEAETCTTIASSMQITEGKPFPVGPSAAYSDDVESTLGKLEKQEKSAASALKKAGKRTSQVAATSKLASAYSGAASSLGKLDVSPADTLLNAQLVAALKTAGGAYKKAAAEGKSKDRAGYKREGAKAVAAEKDMAAALDGLANAGYTLPASLTKGAANFTTPADADQGQAEGQEDVLGGADADEHGADADQHGADADQHGADADQHRRRRRRRRPPRRRPPRRRRNGGSSPVTGGGEG